MILFYIKRIIKGQQLGAKSEPALQEKIGHGRGNWLEFHPALHQRDCGGADGELQVLKKADGVEATARSERGVHLQRGHLCQGAGSKGYWILLLRQPEFDKVQASKILSGKLECNLKL